MRRIFAVFVILVALYSIYWSIRLARADILSQRDSIDSREAAAQLTPGDAKTWIRLAHLQQQRGRDSVRTFTRAARVNPWSAEAWIGLGLEQELAGHFDLAERALLQAAQVSKEYIPRSTLANFYFRRNNPAHFWPWARQALEVARGDQQNIFRMCWALSDDGGMIARDVLPDRHWILAQYLTWLNTTGRLEAAEPIAARLLRYAGEDKLSPLLFYCEMQVLNRRIQPAKAVWSQLVAKHLLPPMEDWSATGVVNGEFTLVPMNSGFDWRLPHTEGVNVRLAPHGLRVTFSGHQPENCEPLWQFIPLQGGRRYRLWYEYQTTDIPRDSGLAWRVYDLPTRAELTRNSPSVMREQTGRESLTFSTPAHSTGGLLVLSYIRAPGTIRVNGWLQLKQIGLQAVD